VEELMEQRRQLRVSRSLLAKITTPAASFFAYVADLARGGLGFACNYKFTIGDPLEISLNVPGRPTLALSGRVAWLRTLPSVSKNKYFYGVAVPEPPEAFTRLVEEMVRRDFERRHHPRFRDVLVVDHKDVLDLLDASTQDISAGGLYIGTNQPLEVGREYTVKLQNEHLMTPIICLVEVLGVYDTSAAEFDHPYGAGVRFLSFEGDGKQRLAEYIKGLEELYRYHWPPKASGAAGAEEIEIKID
jgi:Tfp pilus assembly protein PilZ